jgi:hypothetical protein
MLKHSFSFLAGALLVSSAVVYAGASYAAIFGLGCFVSIASLVCICRAIGFGRVARFFSKLDSFFVGAPLKVRPQSEAFPRSRAEAIRKRKTGLQSSAMLPTVQQEVLSALVNLGMPFREAEKSVRAAAQDEKGQSFDELFRACLPLPNVSRKVA